MKLSSLIGLLLLSLAFLVNVKTFGQSVSPTEWTYFEIEQEGSKVLIAAVYSLGSVNKEQIELVNNNGRFILAMSNFFGPEAPCPKEQPIQVGFATEIGKNNVTFNLKLYCLDGDLFCQLDPAERDKEFIAKLKSEKQLFVIVSGNSTFFTLKESTACITKLGL